MVIDIGSLCICNMYWNFILNRILVLVIIKSWMLGNSSIYSSNLFKLIAYLFIYLKKKTQKTKNITLCQAIRTVYVAVKKESCKHTFQSLETQ